MTTAEQRYVAILRSRGVQLLLILLGVAMTVGAPYLVAPATIAPESSALALPFSLIMPAWGTALMLLAVTVTMYYINRRYNILRTSRIVYAGLFMIMAAGAPLPAGESLWSCLLALIMLWSMAMLYALYNRPAERRQVLLLGVMCGSMMILHRATALYIPVIIIGLTQMRVFSLKSLAALLIGILTPAWILWAIFDVEFNFNFSVWRQSPVEFFSQPGLWRPLASAAVSLAAGFFMGLMVLIKVLTLNARARALNGLLALLAIATGLFMIIDFENICFYLTLLNATVAFQVAHFFRLNRFRSGYLSVTILILLYIAIYLWPSTLL